MSSSDKRKHKTLSAEAEIMKKPDIGEKLINLAKEYDGRATMYAMSAFNTCFKWAEENNVQAEDIRTLKTLQEKVLKEAFKNDRKLLTPFFFVKTQ
jgi:hypothetical protein